MTLRGRLIALAVAVALIFAAAVLVLVRSRTPDCTVAAPRPSLAPVLRALGDFDQGYNSANVPAIEDAAVRAAGTLHGDLIGTTAEAPVMVTAATPESPNAMVVPLRSHSAASGTPPLAGLVVFLRDCQGNAYFDTVEDDATTRPALLSFPPVSGAQAATRLGTPAVQLEYVASPLRPIWVDSADAAQTLPAR